MSLGVPLKIMHEAAHHIVTVELKTGEMFTGYMAEAEDTMNVRLDEVQMVTRDGRPMSLEQVYLRGSQIRFVVIPDVFKYAPMFKKIRANAKSKNMQQIREKARQVREELVPRIKQGLEQQKK
ncbi:unnamed protein product (macronuclear) [Paramecium tetraurelia]|uniref:Small nuclear ribonucleoprotein Sm D3 n=2 Tax=Paramecium tetraurelia TaxID=5888 RepID=A0C6K6_PARTE|nr:uncharacterized protein GSPATT00035552001 [Paramecium tetraurelia]XP_001458499.1 uncharacterized protein GSPATT00023830001 [Paramecium tetraurelia]CAK66423.1 unnamed protein product [Paramecium tetraurelia]CAK91102.1 unnamed protein product [Paramecium tetraurelia]|eukprot:XP_001433820.1 hypothetical protein (macronuclear) [Paramecium tetraurelia strain d4-2]